MRSAFLSLALASAIVSGAGSRFARGLNPVVKAARALAPAPRYREDIARGHAGPKFTAEERAAILARFGVTEAEAADHAFLPPRYGRATDEDRRRHFTAACRRARKARWRREAAERQAAKQSAEAVS